MLFALDPAQAEAEVARAEAAVTTAEATHDNLLTGKREHEIAVIRAQIAQAEASLDLARKELTRADTLASTGTAAQSRLDQAPEQVSLLAARLTRTEGRARMWRSLPARGPEIDAATSRVDEAKAQLEHGARRSWPTSRPRPRADAKVEDVFFEPGEWVRLASPSSRCWRRRTSRCASSCRKPRWPRPRPARRSPSPAMAAAGSSPPPSPGRREPEYTPPVIYSQGARAKLVYLVEAKPDARIRSCAPACPSKWSRCNDDARHRRERAGEDLWQPHGRRSCRPDASCRAASAAFSVPTARARPRRCA